MDKKITWGIIVLVATLIIIGVVFVVDREDPQTGENGDVAEEMQDELPFRELRHEVADMLTVAHYIIYDIYGDLDNEDLEEYEDIYMELDDQFWTLKFDFQDGDISEDEYEEGLKNLLEDARDLASELEDQDYE